MDLYVSHIDTLLTGRAHSTRRTRGIGYRVIRRCGRDRDYSRAPQFFFPISASGHR